MKRDYDVAGSACAVKTMSRHYFNYRFSVKKPVGLVYVVRMKNMQNERMLWNRIAGYQKVQYRIYRVLTTKKVFVRL